MSYDLMVFDHQVPPSDREAFLSWYEEQAKWSEGHTYNDPAVTTPALRAWFMDMIQKYPAINGPFKTDDVDSDQISDYCIGRSVVYIGFAWSIAESAYDDVFLLAEKHRVGFFDVSANDGGVWMPQSDGRLVCVHGDAGPRPTEPLSQTKKWWEFWK
jgi:hypothetical protein